MYTTTSNLCHAGDQTQGFMHARQTPYQMSYISTPGHFLFKKKKKNLGPELF